MEISPKTIQDLLNYNPETGVITRKSNGGSLPTPKAGILGTHIYTSHLAWVLHYGYWPSEEVDHKNHDNADNRIENLRECSRTSNMQNRRWTNPNGKGVTYRGDKKDGRQWQAQIQVNKRRIQLGFFATKEAAALAYSNAALLYHGEFACLD